MKEEYKEIVLKLSPEDLQSFKNDDEDSMSQRGIETLGQNKTLLSIFKRKSNEKKGAKLPYAAKLPLTALQAPTFDFLDEIIGSGTKLLGGDYKSSRDIVRGATKSFQEENPITSLLSQLGATLPAFLVNPPAALAKTGQTLGKFALKRPKTTLMGTGAGTGFVSGLGASEAETPYGLLSDATISAGIGSVATPLLYGLGSTLSKIPQSRFTSRSPELVAKSKILEAVKRDEMTIPQLLEGMKSKQNILGVSGGRNLEDLLDVTASLPSITKQRVEDLKRNYAGGLKERLTANIKEELNPTDLDFTKVVQQQGLERKAIVDPLYDEFRKFSFEVPDNSALEKILERTKSFQRTAKQKADKEGRIFTLDPEVAKFDRVSATDIDYLKRSIDSAIGKNLRSGDMDEVRIDMDLKKELLDIIDQQTEVGGTSAYKAARDAFASQVAKQTHLKNGREFFSNNKVDATDLQLYFDTLNEGEKQLFKLGAYETIRRRLGKNVGKRNLIQARSAELGGEEEVADKLKVLFKTDESWEKFVNNIDTEATNAKIKNIGRGSRTLPRQEEASDLARQANDLLVGTTLVKAGQPQAALPILAKQPFIRNLLNQASTPQNVRDEIGKLLTLQGAGKDFAFMKNIESNLTKKLEEERLRRMLASNLANLTLLPQSNIGALTGSENQ